MRFLVLTFGLTSALPAMAADMFAFPIPIPQECVAVAQREHVPTVVKSKTEATKAKLRLDQLNDRDPMVLQCKQSVARLMASM
jgi:hypothetical protein